jgi:hypothetical protein
MITVCRTCKRPPTALSFCYGFWSPATTVSRLSMPAVPRGREGVVELGSRSLRFQTLVTGEHSTDAPLMFIRHNVGIVQIAEPSVMTLSVRPKKDGAELLWLRRVLVEPVQ